VEGSGTVAIQASRFPSGFVPYPIAPIVVMSHGFVISTTSRCFVVG
jgi:hypothetical protein